MTSRRASPPIATVIVPFCNSASTLPGCLAALRAQTVALELIFVDDGSTDSGPVLLTECSNVRLLTQPNSGPAAARNYGVREASTDIILFTDADCEPQPGWAKALLDGIADPNMAGAKGVYRTTQDALTARFVQIEYQEKYRYMSDFESIDFIDTYSAIFRKSVFEHDQFDESFPLPSVEDQEFSFRLAAQGYRFRFCPDAVVYHRHANSPLRYLRKKLKIGYWKARILRAMPERVTGDSHTPVSLKVQLLATPALIATLLALPWLGSFGCWLSILLIAAHLAANYGLWREARRSDPVLMPLVPLFSWLRSLGLCAGLAWGMLSFRHRR